MGNRWAAVIRLVGIGWYIGISIALGIGVGVWLDRTVHTEPLFTLIGLFLGLAVAIFGTYRLLLPLVGQRQDKDGEDG